MDRLKVFPPPPWLVSAQADSMTHQSPIFMEAQSEGKQKIISTICLQLSPVALIVKQ